VLDTVLLSPESTAKSAIGDAVDTNTFNRIMAQSYEHKDSQLAWLEQTLSDGLQDDTIQWTFAFGHYPIYSAGDSHGDDAQLIKDILPLFLK